MRISVFPTDIMFYIGSLAKIGRPTENIFETVEKIWGFPPDFDQTPESKKQIVEQALSDMESSRLGSLSIDEILATEEAASLSAGVLVAKREYLQDFIMQEISATCLEAAEVLPMPLFTPDIEVEESEDGESNVIKFILYSNSGDALNLKFTFPKEAEVTECALSMMTVFINAISRVTMFICDQMDIASEEGDDEEEEVEESEEEGLDPDMERDL